jgi:hypothetical protein
MVWLTDDGGNPRELFPIGQTVFVAGRGLHATTPYEFSLLDETRRGKAGLLARYTTDRHGALTMAPLLPYVGLVQQGHTSTRSY